MTEDLYTTKQVSAVRALLHKEQNGKCALSQVEVGLKDCHVDHKHDSSQLVRGALYKQSNMSLGKLEGLWQRYLAYWYPGTLSQFLRQAADYIEKTQDTRYRHPGWIKKTITAFTQLKEPVKDAVLVRLELDKQTNAKQRKEIFHKAVLSRKYTFNQLIQILEKEKRNVK